MANQVRQGTSVHTADARSGVPGEKTGGASTAELVRWAKLLSENADVKERSSRLQSIASVYFHAGHTNAFYAIAKLGASLARNANDEQGLSWFIGTAAQHQATAGHYEPALEFAAHLDESLRTFWLVHIAMCCFEQDEDLAAAALLALAAKPKRAEEHFESNKLRAQMIGPILSNAACARTREMLTDAVHLDNEQLFLRVLAIDVGARMKAGKREHAVLTLLVAKGWVLSRRDTVLGMDQQELIDFSLATLAQYVAEEGMVDLAVELAKSIRNDIAARGEALLNIAVVQAKRGCKDEVATLLRQIEGLKCARALFAFACWDLARAGCGMEAMAIVDSLFGLNGVYDTTGQGFYALARIVEGCYETGRIEEGQFIRNKLGCYSGSGVSKTMVEARLSSLELARLTALGDVDPALSMIESASEGQVVHLAELVASVVKRGRSFNSEQVARMAALLRQ